MRILRIYYSNDIMQYINRLILIGLFFLPFQVFGQTKHELKTDALFFTAGEITLSYEVIFKNQLALEFGLGYEYADISIAKYDSLRYEQFDFAQKSINPSIIGKYYLVPERRIDYGFYAGFYSKFNILLETEDAYFDKHEEIYPNSKSSYEENGLKNISVGFGVGYKFLIKSHFVIEPAFFLFREFNIPSLGVFSINSDLRIGVGYRF